MTKHLYIFKMESNFYYPKNLDEPNPHIFARYVWKPLLGNINFGKPLLGKQPLGNSPWESTLGKLLPWE